MAHVVGVPRRDPCQKCKFPVFLAERLAVGKKIYHRTCLKCARCGTQLSPGSFYETEVDDEYCCETCPDEEVIMNADVEVRSTTTASPAPTARTVRSSIADRLAFFEQNKNDRRAEASTDSPVASNKLLQRSVTDEEKTKSLQRMEAATTTYKGNTALSSFIYDDIDGNDDSTTASIDKVSIDTKMETTDTEDEDTTADDTSLEQVVPELPKTQPPPLEEASNHLERFTPTPTKRFTATAQLQLETTSKLDEQAATATSSPAHVEKMTPAKVKTEVQLNLVEASNRSNSNEENLEETHKLSRTSVEMNKLDVDETNDNRNCVTKEKTADTTNESAAQPRTMIVNIDEIKTELRKLETESSTDEEVVELRKISDVKRKSIEDEATTERLSVVRARLQQFEVIANNKINNNNIENENNKLHQSEDDQVSTSPEQKQNSNISLSEDITNHANITQNNLKTVDDSNIEIEQTTQTTVEKEIKETSSQESIESPSKVPLAETAEQPVSSSNEKSENPERVEKLQDEVVETKTENMLTEQTNVATAITVEPALNKYATIKEYPEDLNPFQSDDEEEVHEDATKTAQQNKEHKSKQAQNSNPFDSSDDEIELEKPQFKATTPKVPPPRPPPPRISPRNPFGEEDEVEEDNNFSRRSSLSLSFSKKTPVPTPRSNLSRNPTPEPAIRHSHRITPATPNTSLQHIIQNSNGDYYGSSNSLATTPQSMQRNSEYRGSNNSLTSSTGSTIRSRKNRKAPAPPITVKELFPSTETIDSSKTSTPSSSTMGTPKMTHKKRHAPPPPKPARLDPSITTPIATAAEVEKTALTPPKNSLSYSLQSELDSKLSDEEKALLESNRSQLSSSNELTKSQRIIPLDASILNDVEAEHSFSSKSDDIKHNEIRLQHNGTSSSNQQNFVIEDETNIVYRRMLIAPKIDTPTHEHDPLYDSISKQQGDRQLEKLKDNKESKNRNRQSQLSVASSGTEDGDSNTMLNKSAHGKWKRRKGPAPALPIPPRKVLQMLPLQEIKHELEIIEVQQQGLEKQGVTLEQMIRDRCEGQNGEQIGINVNIALQAGDNKLAGITTAENVQNSKEVEDLILQLFELVNEKNELFRRQAELMYLRRQHRLEQEQADLEYEIRVLMAQPERNKTDSDKAREEALIARLLEVVQLRNEVVECLEMDRVREAEEDLSIKQHLEEHASQREYAEELKKPTGKLSKKEKKKQKEAKKLFKSKKIDVEKDADESELSLEKQKKKKKKIPFLNML